jgi:hypothetical protein
MGVDSPFQREHAGFARGFLLRRYGILRSRAAPRALMIEGLVVGWGLIRHGTLLPLRARVHGWQAARNGGRHPVPLAAIDREISVVQSLRRLRTAR